MSGHFATLLRGTVETFLPDHEVYITDWQDARDVPLAAGRFDLDDYIDTMADMFRFFGGDVHVFAVCQPSVPVLAATALMEADGDPAVPLIADPGRRPDRHAHRPDRRQHAGREARHRLVPPQRHHQRALALPGRGRQVYPGFLQLSGFMTMNLDRHMQAQKDMFMHLVHGDGDSADKHREFYDEYLAVMDLTAEFYLQTVDTVFVQHLMPRGLMTSRGRPIDLSAIRRPALMTVEGEKDDITGTGQCRAALDLCVNIPAEQQAALRVSEGRALRHLQRLALPLRDRSAHGRVHARARSLRRRRRSPSPSSSTWRRCRAAAGGPRSSRLSPSASPRASRASTASVAAAAAGVAAAVLAHHLVPPARRSHRAASRGCARSSRCPGGGRRRLLTRPPSRSGARHCATSSGAMRSCRRRMPLASQPSDRMPTQRWELPAAAVARSPATRAAATVAKRCSGAMRDLLVARG